MKQIFKLAGVTAEGNFDYEKIEGLKVFFDVSGIHFQKQQSLNENFPKEVKKLSVEKMEEVHGYRLISNESSVWGRRVHRQIVLDTRCNGEFVYTIRTWADGNDEEMKEFHGGIIWISFSMDSGLKKSSTVKIMTFF